MLQHQPIASPTPYATGISRRRVSRFGGAIADFSNPLNNLNIFSGTKRQFGLQELTLTPIIGGKAGLSFVPFSQTFQSPLLAGYTDPFGTSSILSWVKRAQPLRGTGATAPSHFAPLFDGTLTLYCISPILDTHSGECAAPACSCGGGRLDQPVPSHSPFDFLKHSIYSPPLFYYRQGAAVHAIYRRANHMNVHPARRFRHNHKAEINSESSVRERRPLFFSRHFVQFFFITSFKLDRGTERPVGESCFMDFPHRPPFRVLSGPSVIREIR